MKKLHIAAATFTGVLMLAGLHSKAQTAMSNPPGDTTTVVLSNNDTNFDLKRSQVFTDKRSVDSLANVLAANDKQHYRIVYRKEGKEGLVVSRKEFRNLNRAGVYRIMIAYNKKGQPGDDAPIYVVTSK